MKAKSITASLILGAAACGAMPAQAAEPDTSGFTFDANVSLASQYRYRGLMQTNNKPALQGGFNLTHSSGFYIGNWNSTISWLGDSDPDVSAPLEMDFFAGYAGPLWGDFTVDTGVLQYYYPGDYPGGYTRPHTTELFLGLGYGPVSFKYSHALTNLFGVPDSKNSQYFELNASVPTGVWGLNVDGHVGYQRVRNLDDGSYTDWSLGFSKSWNSFTAALTYVDTNADRDVYTNSKGRYTGKAAVMLTLTQTF